MFYNPFKLFIFTLLLSTFLFISCNDGATEDEPSEPPVADFFFSPSSYEPTYTDIKPTGDIESYRWSINYEEISISETATHQFDDMGTKSVTLYVEGPGGYDNITKKITIREKYISIPEVWFQINDLGKYYFKVMLGTKALYTSPVYTVNTYGFKIW